MILRGFTLFPKFPAHKHINRNLNNVMIATQHEAETSINLKDVKNHANIIQPINSTILLKEDSIEKLSRQIDDLSSEEDSIEKLSRQIDDLSSEEILPEDFEKDILETTNKLIDELKYDNDKYWLKELSEEETKLMKISDSDKYSQDSILLSERKTNIQDRITLLKEIVRSNHNSIE
jgi:hypothetical protein